MPGMIAISKASRPVRSQRSIDAMFDRTVLEIGPIPGLESTTLWKSVSDDATYLAMHHLSNETAAQELEVRFGESKIVEAVVEAFVSPMDYRQGIVTHQHGSFPGETSINHYLSLSDRSADPGLGDELESELKRVFGELSQIPGYLGSMITRNPMLPEEVMGIVLWESEGAFQQSIPLKMLYEVQLFVRER